MVNAERDRNPSPQLPPQKWPWRGSATARPIKYFGQTLYWRKMAMLKRC